MDLQDLTDLLHAGTADAINLILVNRGQDPVGVTPAGTVPSTRSDTILIVGAIAVLALFVVAKR